MPSHRFCDMAQHHVITSNLIFWSYYGNYTRMGACVNTSGCRTPV